MVREFAAAGVQLRDDSDRRQPAPAVGSETSGRPRQSLRVNTKDAKDTKDTKDTEGTWDYVYASDSNRDRTAGRERVAGVEAARSRQGRHDVVHRRRVGDLHELRGRLPV